MIGHLIVALVFAVAGAVCICAGCLALYRRGRYWGMIFLMSCVGLINCVLILHFQLGAIADPSEIQKGLAWFLYLLMHGSFVTLCAMTAVIYMIHWRPPSERNQRNNRSLR